MVVLEHIGFGGRDVPLHLYFWDLRDGEDFTGWWVTADYIGNNDFILAASEPNASTPSEIAVGKWRSPNVEQMQVRRSPSNNSAVTSLTFVCGASVLVCATAQAEAPSR